MYADTIKKCSANAARIVKLDKTDPISFLISGAMAGAYVGLGIILIFPKKSESEVTRHGLVSLQDSIHQCYCETLLLSITCLKGQSCSGEDTFPLTIV